MRSMLGACWAWLTTLAACWAWLMTLAGCWAWLMTLAGCNGESTPDACDAAVTCAAGDVAAVLETVLLEQPSDPSSTTTATFRFRASRNEGTFRCWLDDKPPTACASGIAYTDLAPGPHTFAVAARSALGLDDPTPATFSWRVSAPQADPVLVCPRSPLASAATAVSFTTTRGGDFSCSLDDAPFATCSSPLVILGLSEGKHTFQVRTLNDPMPVSCTWIVDAVPSVVRITGGPNENGTSGPAVYFTYQADHPSVTFRCLLDGREAESGDAESGGIESACPATGMGYTQLGAGDHTFAVVAIDSVGRVSLPDHRHWTVVAANTDDNGDDVEPE